MDKIFMQAVYDTALTCDLPIISSDTAARILAVTYVHGNNEFMCHSDKFMTEIGYIQRRFGIQGGDVPDANLVKLIQQYVEQLKLFMNRNPDERYPQWAMDMFEQRYGFKLIN